MRCKSCGNFIDASNHQCPYCGMINEVKETPYVQNNLFQNQAETVYNKNVNGVCEITILEKGSPVSAGTGFLINREGYLLTNTHVATIDNKPAKEVLINIAHTQVQAKVIALGDDRGGHGKGEDLAILKIDSIPNDAKILKLDDSSRIKNGEEVFFIGNSLGDGLCITRGIISDKERLVGGHKRIMTDAAINPGNSGGPLLNTSGNVIGVCVAARVVNKFGIAADGMKYAIPINIAKTFCQKFNVNF